MAKLFDSLDKVLAKANQSSNNATAKNSTPLPQVKIQARPQKQIKILSLAFLINL